MIASYPLWQVLVPLPVWVQHQQLVWAYWHWQSSEAFSSLVWELEAE
jgi:hypothetical protein